MASVDNELSLPWFFNPIPGRQIQAFAKPLDASATMQNVAEQLREDYLIDNGWKPGLCTIVEGQIVVGMSHLFHHEYSPAFCFLFRNPSLQGTIQGCPDHSQLFRAEVLKGSELSTAYLEWEPLNEALKGTGLITYAAHGSYNTLPETTKKIFRQKDRLMRTFQPGVAYICVGTISWEKEYENVQSQLQEVKRQYNKEMKPLRQRCAYLESLYDPSGPRKRLVLE